MGIFSKVNNTGSSTDWRSAKKVWVKVSTTLWRSANALYGKTLNGWVKMWPGNAPSVRPSDPINIRLGGYNGTIADSVELFCSTNAGTSGTFLKLWGNDGSFDGATPITITNRRMLCSDNIDGQSERFSLSGNDTIDFATTTQANRDLAEGYYIFYQLLATNVDGSLQAYSPPVKVIKRRPALLNYTVLSETGGQLQGDDGSSAFDVIELNAQIRWGWWIRPGGYLGGTPVLKWWRNTTGNPGGTLLKEIDIETGYNYVSGSIDLTYNYDTNTSNVLTIYSNYGVGNTPLQAGEYIVAELYLENSYTAHYAAPVIFYGATQGAAIAAPTSLTATTNRGDGVLLNWNSVPGANYYEIYWQSTQGTGPVNQSSFADFGTDNSITTNSFLDTTISAGSTRYYRVRARSSETAIGSNCSNWFPGPTLNAIAGTRTAAYNVSWDGNGGSSGNEGIPWSFTEGGSVTVPSATRIGYDFVRWADTPSGDYTYTTTNIGGTFFPPAQNITMYARWQIRVCTIPNVIGMLEYDAALAVNEAGFLYEYREDLYTSDPALDGRVAAIDPPVGSQPGCAINITLTIYSYVQPIIPTISMFGNSSITQTSGQINWTSTNQATFSSTGAFSATGTTQTFVAKTGLSPGTTYTGTVTVTSSTGHTASANYSLSTAGSTFTMPNLIGLTRSAAGQAIVNAGFYWEDDYPYTTGNPSLDQIVFAQTPEAGFVGIPQNAYFDYYVYSPPVQNLTPPSISSVASGTAGGPVTAYFSGGSGPYYQIWWTTGSAGTSYDESGSSSPITDNTGPTSAGTYYMYVRSVSSPTNTGTGPSTTISAWSTGYAFTVSNPVTCGSCQDYGSATYTGQTTGCAGTYYTVYNNYSIGQRQTCSDGSYQYCANRTYSTVSSSTQIDGQCGYTAPVACVCNYSDYGSYHYSSQCCPSGTQRTGSLSGVTSGACCPNVYKTLRYVCKSYDVTNSASVNYYDCYSVGQCAAQQNPDGSRATCYI